jgi:hypothetical protein
VFTRKGRDTAKERHAYNGITRLRKSCRYRCDIGTPFLDSNLHALLNRSINDPTSWLMAERLAARMVLGLVTHSVTTTADVCITSPSDCHVTRQAKEARASFELSAERGCLALRKKTSRQIELRLLALDMRLVGAWFPETAEGPRKTLKLSFLLSSLLALLQRQELVGKLLRTFLLWSRGRGRQVFN